MTGPNFDDQTPETVTPRKAMDHFGICANAALTAAYARDGAWLQALRHANAALDAGLRHGPGDLLDDVRTTLTLMAQWYGAQAVAGEGVSCARPADVHFVCDIWAAVEGATWRPDEEESLYGGQAVEATLAASRTLRREHRNRMAIEAFRDSRAGLFARMREADKWERRL